MEDSTVLGLAGIIAGLGVGLGTALMSFWWNYKTRALPHREFLYERQIEGYLELSTAMCRLLRPCYDFLWANNLTPENHADFVKILLKAQDDLHEEMRKSLAILPIDVGNAVLEFYSKLANDVPEFDSKEKILAALVDGQWGVYEAIRKLAGVEPLTKDMLRVFGEHT